LSDIDELTAAKREERKRLAALPVVEKLIMLELLRQRSLTFRGLAPLPSKLLNNDENESEEQAAGSSAKAN
jgi:hypothetical protein